jgi:hypothetical protein
MGLTSVRNLVYMLEDGMKALGANNTLRARVAENEYMINDDHYGFSYHTWVYTDQMDEATLIQQNEIKINYLKRKFIEELDDGEKIFVYRRSIPTPFSEIIALHTALNQYGAAKLFWVSEAGPGQAYGSVEWYGKRLLRGYIEKIPNDDLPGTAEAWLTLCRNATIAFANSTVT